MPDNHTKLMLERIDGRRAVAVAGLPRHHDGLNWHAFAHVERYSRDQAAWAEHQFAQIHPVLSQLSLDALPPLVRRETQAVLAGLLRRAGEPEDGYAQVAGNLLVTEGLNQVTQLIIGSGGTSFSNTHGLVAVGDSTTAAAVGDTYVTATFTAGTNCYQNPNDASFPTQSNGVINSQSTFGSTVANFPWQTWGWAVFNGTAAANATLSAHGTAANQAVLVNHKVASLGTKGSGAAWVFSSSVTLS